MDSEAPDYVAWQLHSLGEVIQWSAAMESILRDAFCSLVGSKFAAIVAGGQSAAWLIEQCQALTEAHHEMTQEQRDSIKTALDRCAAANEQRNHLVHGVKTGIRVSDGTLETIKSRALQYLPKIEKWTPATIHEAANELLLAGLDLSGALQAAVSPGVMAIGDALAWEDRHDEAPPG